MTSVLLSVEDLQTFFFTERGVARAVDRVSFSLAEGGVLGIVGESGCGKSVTALSIMRLVPSPPGRIVGGRILFDGRDLLSLPESEMESIRGNDISMIFQEPMTSLNPVYTIGNQITEAIILHQGLHKSEAHRKAIEVLGLVGIPTPEKAVNAYPHQLSGGMRQRAMIAMALSCRPKLLIADEPTTALDVTIQAQILRLINELKKQIDMAVMMITHDLGVIAQVADDVVVAYAGKGVEYADAETVFERPAHPYTRALYHSIPHLRETRKRKLEVIQGTVPNPLSFPSGCRFHPRCVHAVDLCTIKEPELEEIGSNHRVRCLMYNQEARPLFQ